MGSKLKLIVLQYFARLGYFLRLPIPPIAAACVTIVQKDKVLAIDLSYRQGLSLPGGGLKFNETLEEAAIREVKEETNLEITDLAYLSSHKYISESHLSYVSACFLGKVKDSSSLKGSSEGKPYWVKPNYLYKNASYADVKKHIQDYFKL